MNTLFKLAAIGSLLACAGSASAGSPTLAASLKYPPGPVRINPQPLPPLGASLPTASAGHALSPIYPPGPVRINPQPLPPLDSRRP